MNKRTGMLTNKEIGLVAKAARFLERATPMQTKRLRQVVKKHLGKMEEQRRLRMIPLRQIRDDKDPKAFPLRIKDKSNQPLLKPRDAVLASPSVRWTRGDICVVELKNRKRIIGITSWADLIGKTKRIERARISVEPYASYWALKTGDGFDPRYRIHILERKEIKRICGIRQMVFA